MKERQNDVAPFEKGGKDFSDSGKTDFWDELSCQLQEEILKGIEEIENGETVNYQDIISKHLFTKTNEIRLIS